MNRDQPFCRLVWASWPEFAMGYPMFFYYLLLRWFKPERHKETLLDWMSSLSCRVQKRYHVLDLFGASKRVAETWEKAGWKGIAYDIQLDGKLHDITSELGWKTLARMGIEFLAFLAAKECKRSLFETILN